MAAPVLTQEGAQHLWRIALAQVAVSQLTAHLIGPNPPPVTDHTQTLASLTALELVGAGYTAFPLPFTDWTLSNLTQGAAALTQTAIWTFGGGVTVAGGWLSWDGAGVSYFYWSWPGPSEGPYTFSMGGQLYTVIDPSLISVP